ncbi:serine/threonine-protein kinase Sgk1 isoform X2 [Stigmatopora argus]
MRNPKVNVEKAARVRSPLSDEARRHRRHGAPPPPYAASESSMGCERGKSGKVRKRTMASHPEHRAEERDIRGSRVLPGAPPLCWACGGHDAWRPRQRAQPSPTQQINLGPSSNPSAKPNDFHFLKVIGKGSFGKVLLARHRSDERFYAVKVLQKKAILKKKEEKHIMCERNVLLKNVKHPFLVGLHYSFQTTDKLYFVLDYINGGELFYHLQRERCFLEPRARFYAAEIASALGYLHSLNIVYRDLKPENILLDSQGHVVLTDFGLCKENIEPDGTTSTFCGTPEYLAPEVLHKQPYDRTVDWWCLGAVLYEMLYGLPPFYSRNTAEMYDNILNKPLQLKPNISNAARHLLEGLLQKERSQRLGRADDFVEIQKHVFFSPINWDELNAKKITPPFNPNVTGPNDLRHFDPEFTEEPVPNSIGRSSDSVLATSSVQEAFAGFSYAPSADSYL